jgi:methanogenic corrinoid protein MtbC1
LNNAGGSTTGKFTVAEVEERSGVPATSLRQWERRYGFPKPQRAPSGYRYYSEHDVIGIMRLRDLIAQGIAPSRAASIVKEEPPVATTTARPPADLARDMGAALETLDLFGADRVLSEAFALHSVETVLFEVVRPAMIHVGDLWHAGAISIATEHLASNHVQGRLRALIRSLPTGAHRHRIIVACAPGEQHEMGALMLTIALRRAGNEVLYLGAATPIQDLAAMATEVAPDAVLISATTAESVLRLRAAKDQLVGVAPLLVLGGQGFARLPEVVAELGGTTLGDDVQTIAGELMRLLEVGAVGG